MSPPHKQYHHYRTPQCYENFENVVKIGYALGVGDCSQRRILEKALNFIRNSKTQDILDSQAMELMKNELDFANAMIQQLKKQLATAKGISNMEGLSDPAETMEVFVSSSDCKTTARKVTLNENETGPSEDTKNVDSSSVNITKSQQNGDSTDDGEGKSLLTKTETLLMI